MSTEIHKGKLIPFYGKGTLEERAKQACHSIGHKKKPKVYKTWVEFLADGYYAYKFSARFVIIKDKIYEIKSTLLYNPQIAVFNKKEGNVEFLISFHDGVESLETALENCYNDD